MIQNFVTIDHYTHTYTDVNGDIYTSVSRVLDTVDNKFDAETMSRNCAGRGKYVGMTQEEVKAQWLSTAKESTDHGSRIHNALETYSKTFTIKKEDVDLEPMIKSVTLLHKDYVRTYDECILYHPGYKVAGTADKILLPTSRSGYVDIEDFKTNIKKGIVFHNEYGKFKKFPVEHLSDCNYNRYALQLSIYGFMFEYLTKKKIRKMWLTFIPEANPMNHVRIPVPYMKTDAIAILENFKKMQENKYVFFDQGNENNSEEPNFTI